ncbi:hypothetical protein YA0002_11470 [Pseudomonas cichorii]|uniref:hypothetical protein n=1 Tax=Pseudomonas cichorii TaxID=36746 RepID=UPI0018E63F9B|nr:hypothetical protein [Pseudomonas cichorii]MBI6853386.1 hypothetical protein [Pseudomonas cichorii]
MSRLTVITERLENGLQVINQISKILVNNLALEGGDPAPQLDTLDTDALLNAVNLISTQAHDDLCELMNDFPPEAIRWLQ